MDITLNFRSGFVGNIYLEVMIDGERNIMEAPKLKEYLLKQIEERGYTLSKKGRQEIGRITIND